MRHWIVIGLVCATPALAQDKAALDEAVRRGTIAALAPICGLREEGWAFDLRRATIMEATGTTRPDDAALEHAPGSQLVVGAMSYAETEALEDFAEAVPAVTCGPLARDPALGRADAIVEAFRALKASIKPGS